MNVRNIILIIREIIIWILFFSLFLFYLLFAEENWGKYFFLVPKGAFPNSRHHSVWIIHSLCPLCCGGSWAIVWCSIRLSCKAISVDLQMESSQGTMQIGSMFPLRVVFYFVCVPFSFTPFLTSLWISTILSNTAVPISRHSYVVFLHFIFVFLILTVLFLNYLT